MEEKLQNGQPEAVETSKKKKKKLLPVILIVCALILCAAVVAALFIFDVIDFGEDPSTESTQPVGTASSKLFWNVDGKAYVADSASGLTSRRKIKGFFDVRFMVDGEIVTYKVKDARLMIHIDRRDLMGLVFDEDGVIIDLLDVWEIAGGEIASYYFIMSIDGNKITANSMDDGRGMSQEFEISDDTKIYNVSSMAETVGESCTLGEYDRIRVIVDENGKVTTVYVVEKDAMAGYCAHCGGEAVWRYWTSTVYMPTSTGHYKLLNDVILKDGQASVKQDSEVVLDLNGKTVKNLYGKRLYALFYENSHLAVMDTSEEQTGRMMVEGSYNGQGMIVWTRYGSFKLYSGTLDASAASSTGAGLCVGMNTGTTFEMYGGTLIGGTATSTPNGKGGYTAVNGGAVFVAKDCTFNMYGGVIRDGYAKAYVVDGSYKGGYAGNVYVASYGTMNMHGGEIKDGKADFIGGNIALGGQDAVFTMTGGTISGGQVININRNSGNIHINANSTFNMEGGTVKDGLATSAGGNITNYGTMTMSGGLITGGKIMTGKSMDELKETAAPSANIHSRNAVLKITGGQIDGYVNIQNADTNKDGIPEPATFYVSGKVKICGGKKNVCLSGTVLMDIGTLEPGSEIRFSTGGFVSSETTQENAKYVFYDDDKLITTKLIEKKIFLGKYQCMCGAVGENGTHIGDCDGTMLEWAPIGTNTLPSKTGNYYLTEDITDAVQATLQKDAIVNLDLNGYSITMAPNPGAVGEGKTHNYYRAFALQNDGAVLSITDSVGGGRIYAGARADSGAIVNLQSKSVFNLYAGILDGTTLKETTVKTLTGVVSAAKGGAVNIYGGQIKGLSDVKAIDLKTNTDTGRTANMIGATLHISKESGLNIYGGKIVGSKALNGGTIYAEGAVAIAQGENCTVPAVTGGTAANGGNIYLTGAKFTMSGGVISSGTANVTASGSGGFGGNIYANNGTDFAVTGGEIYGGAADTNGNNVFIGGNNVKDADGKVTYTGNASITGGTIYGGLSNTGTSLTLGGSVKILDTDKEGKTVEGLKLGGGAYVTMEPLNEDAVIKVDSFGQKIAQLADGAAETLKDQISLGAVSAKENPNAAPVIQDGQLYLRTVRYGCLCGQEKHIGDCDGTLLVWQKLTGSTLPNKTGNYYLDADITEARQGNVEKDAIINLDLNGHTVTMASNPGAAKEGGTYNYFRAFAMNGDGAVLSITDSVGGGKIVAGTRADGGAIVNVQSKSVFNLYAGVMDGTTLNETTVKSITGSVCVSNGGTVNIYGGQIKGLTNVKLIDLKTNTDTGKLSTVLGGAVNVAKDGSLNIYGGTVTGGNANNGGAIYAEGAVSVSQGVNCSVPTVNGGTAANGGNIYLTGAKFTMSAGIISNGTAESTGDSFGGNIYVNNGTDFTVTGGEIYGGTAGTNGNNIFIGGNTVKDSDGKVTYTGKASITGGTIYGGLSNTGTRLTLGGGIKILDTDKAGKTVEGLKLGGGAYVTLEPLNTDAVIKVASAGQKVAELAEGTAATVKKQITSSADPDATPVIEGTSLYLRSMRYGCLCGQEEHIGDCDGTLLVWEKLTGSTLPAKTGNYYLDTDITDAKQANVAAGAIINLDLNGHTVTMAPNPGAAVEGGTYNYFRAFAMNGDGAVLSITDSVGGGKIVAGTRCDGGAIVNIQSDSEFNLYGGILDATSLKETTNANVTGVVSATSGSVNIYGGEIIGVGEVKLFDKATNTDTGTLTNVIGGGLYIAAESEFYADDGTVYGGVMVSGSSATLGGSVKILDTAKDGTTVTDGLKLAADTVITLQKLNSDAVIKVDVLGQKIAVLADGTEQTLSGQLTLAGKTAQSEPDAQIKILSDGVYVKAIRLACLCGQAEHIGACDGAAIEWEAWSSNTALPTESGNYYLTSDVNVSDNFYKLEAGQVINLDLNGKTVNVKARAYTLKDAILTIVDHAGGGVLKTSANAAIQGGIINFEALSGKTPVLNIYSGTLDASSYNGAKDDSLSAEGGAIRAVKGELNIYGGTVIGGSGEKCGGIYVSGSTFTMTGGEVYGGTGTETGGNLYITGASTAAKLLGGTVYGGVDIRTNVFVGGSVKLLDTAKDGETKVEAVKLDADILITVLSGEEALTADAVIKIDAENRVVAKLPDGVTTADQISVGTVTVQTNADASVFVEGSDVIIGTLRTYCLCGKEPHVNSCSGSIVWKPWVYSNKLPTEGNYYLNSDVTVATTFYTLNNGKTLNLDLSGKTVSLRSRAYTVENATLNLIDSVGTGSMVAGTGAAAEGGILYVKNAAASVSIYSGTFDAHNYNQTQNGSGGVALVNNGATLNIYGGTFIGGNARYGGVFYINTANTVFNMTGGTVYGGTASTNGDNIFIGGSAKSASISGGTVYGGPNFAAVVTTGTPLTVSGSAQILDHTVSNEAAYGLIGSNKIKIGTLDAGAVIEIEGDENATVAVFADSAAASGYNYQLTVGQKSRMAGKELCVLPDGNNLVMKEGKIGCVCGGNAYGIGNHVCTNIVWQPWTTAKALPTGGNYYLTANITDCTQQVIAANTTVNLDLNGYTVTMALNSGAATGNYRRTYVLQNAGSVLNITDSSAAKTGRISAGVRQDGGHIVRITSASTFNLYGGILDGSTATQISNTSNTAYGVVQLESNKGGSFNMYGGTVVGIGSQTRYVTSTGDKVGTVSTADVAEYGGALHVGTGTTANMYAGTIQGSATGLNRGGCVYVQGSLTLHSDKALITGGKARDGGNICVIGGTVNMTAGKITNGSAVGSGNSFGGGVYVNNSGSFNMSGGEISGCAADYRGDAMYIGGNANGSVKLTGGVIYDEVGTSGTTVSVGKNITIPGTDKDGVTSEGVVLYDSAYLTALTGEDTLTASAKVVFTASAAREKAAVDVTSAASGCFSVTNSGFKTSLNEATGILSIEAQ